MQGQIGIFAYNDSFKLNSSITVFSVLEKTNSILFYYVLDKFYNDKKDEMTFKLIKLLN